MTSQSLVWICIAVDILLLSRCHAALGSESSNNDTSSVVLEYVYLDNPIHPCARECVPDAPALVCRYEFQLEWYHTMSKACYDCPFNSSDCARPHCVPADGVPRAIVVVNRQMPGPTVQVCKGDNVVVDVTNGLMAESTTIHWHGLHQRGTPYMDGVPHVTQCPIGPGSTFRYQFKADNVGTHFWHSHMGMQRADGAFGAFIVRSPRSRDPHSGLYDYDRPEHTMIVMDWTHELGIDNFLAHHHSSGDNKPPSLLVNAKGRFQQFNNRTSRRRAPKVFFTPVERFVVEQGFRFRFRIINAEFLNCPIEISVDNHTLTIISTDGFDVNPVQAESFVTYAGERFDFIVTADQEIDNYWIRFRGLMDCDERFTKANQVAILHYEGALEVDPEGESTWDNSHKDGLQVNALNKGTGYNDTLSIVELDSLLDTDPSLQDKPDYQFYISYDFYAKDNPHYHSPGLYGFQQVPDKKKRLYTPQLNHISMKLPPFPMLSGRRHLSQEMFCNETSIAGKNCETEYCECTHVLQVPYKSVVELILVDKGFTFDANHPFHLHGLAFRVISMARVGKNVTVEEIKQLDAEGKISRKLKNAPYKDTITVPDGGYTIIRFLADNPGYWLFHCHIEFHVELGMAIVFKVGEDTDMAPVPKGFPQCYNWTPDSLDNETDSSMNEIVISGQWPVMNYTAHSTSSMAKTSVMIMTISFLLPLLYM